MKKFFYLVSGIVIIALITISCQKDSIDAEVSADYTTESTSPTRTPSDCTTIPSGLLVDSGGNPIETGYTEFGYNYQAHMYNGDYGYPEWKLVMKWNEAWLSNKDCDGDLLLDRHLGYDAYRGSGAWLTNHWMTTYDDVNGNMCEYDDFIKIIAAPLDATLTDGIWYNVDGTEIGPMIWGEFAIIQSIINDPCNGIEGIDYNSPDHPGLGNW